MNQVLSFMQSYLPIEVRPSLPLIQNRWHWCSRSLALSLSAGFAAWFPTGTDSGAGWPGARP